MSTNVTSYTSSNLAKIDNNVAMLLEPTHNIAQAILSSFLSSPSSSSPSPLLSSHYQSNEPFLKSKVACLNCLWKSLPQVEVKINIPLLDIIQQISMLNSSGIYVPRNKLETSHRKFLLLLIYIKLS